MKTTRRGLFKALGFGPAAVVLAKHVPPEITESDIIEPSEINSWSRSATCSASSAFSTVDTIMLSKYRK